MIYDMYGKQGMGYNAIAYALNDMHIPARKGEWSQTSIVNIPTTQHILDNYDTLTIAEKNRLWKLVMPRATVYRSPDNELTVNIYPNLPK